MKKAVVLSSAVIVLIGLLLAFRFYVSVDPYTRDQSSGEALMNMEHETTERVENMLGVIQSGQMPPSDCQMEIEEMLKAIIENLNDVNHLEKTYIHIAYNSNVIRQLGLFSEDRKYMKEGELALKRDNLTKFSNEVFNYCLDVEAQTEEKSDYLEIVQWAEKIEMDMEQESKRFTEKIYDWYTGENRDCK